MKFNPAKFENEIKIELDKIKDQVKETAFEAARHAMRVLAKNSPVWSGSYVSSHRVGIDGETDSGPVSKKIYTPGSTIPKKVSEITAERYRATALMRVENKISRSIMPDKGKIIIYNNCAVSPALMVEVLPDKYVTGAMTPYHPFSKAVIDLKANIKSIIKRVEKR